MTYPNDLKYTKDHEWIKIDGAHAFVGVTNYAIEQLGDVVYLELPKVGQTFGAHEAFGTIESTKTVSDLYSPVNCKIVEVNSSVVSTPETLAKDAYKEGWLIKVEVLAPSNELLNSSDYEKYIQGQS